MLPAVRRDPTAVFMDAALRFGDVAYFKIGPRRGFLLTNPADVRHVLQDNARNYHKSPLYEKLKWSIGDGLLTSEDDFWLRQRRIAQPAFNRQRIATLVRGLAEIDQGRSIVSGPVIMGGAFRSFAAVRSRRSWLATWPVMSV
jgi:cytochrome P450